LWTHGSINDEEVGRSGIHQPKWPKIRKKKGERMWGGEGEALHTQNPSPRKDGGSGGKDYGSDWGTRIKPREVVGETEMGKKRAVVSTRRGKDLEIKSRKKKKVKEEHLPEGGSFTAAVRIKKERHKKNMAVKPTQKGRTES